jgi:SAM-dependent methyltransferase
MKKKTTPPCLEPGSAAGDLRTIPLAPDPMAIRSRAVWTAGDFHQIALGFETGAAEFIARLGLRPGEAVLDVACGTGNLARPAARAGACVTGLDIAPNLLATARTLAAEESLTIRFDEGNAEELPYDDDSFDTVVSMFGAMFAPRPDRVAAELLRVTRPGGRIAMANWTAAGFVGAMLKAHTTRVPPPPGIPSPLLWGDPEEVGGRMGPGVRVSSARRTIDLAYSLSPAGTVELFRNCYGPTMRTFEALGPEERAALARELDWLWDTHNLVTDGTRVAAEYLEIVAVVI